MYAQDSIELLKQSGIDFAQNEARGIDVHKFGELLMSSGIVLNEDVSGTGPCTLITSLHACCTCITTNHTLRGYCHHNEQHAFYKSH
jgi:hypothetical protein